ncbi:MAG TPA: ComF family protein [Vicinamibacterales bacterium]|nr:ComF family protein [Vicinamibacterales bacterium]
MTPNGSTSRTSLLTPRKKPEERRKKPEERRKKYFRLPSFVFRLVDGVVAVVLAPACAACRAPLDEPTRGAVCPRCWNAIVPIAPLGLFSLPPHVSLATAIGPYDETLKAIVHALKYDPRSTIARHLAARMRAAGAEVIDGADAVVPIPLHRSRERTRGFNQASELARHLGLPVLGALTRVRKTATQADLPAAKRDANVRGAFAINSEVCVDGLILVLVDDVSTTGATLNACAAPLLDAGAKEVRALTAARAPLKATVRRR